jgi:hypothetical protein
MRSDVALQRACGRASDDIAERLFRADPAKPAGLPLAQVILNATLARFSEEPPWFPARSGHDSNVFELVVSVLGAVSAPESLNQANDLTTLLKTAFNEGRVDQVRKKWVRGYEDVPPRNKHPNSARAPLPKELLELSLFIVAENSEARDWSPDAPADGRGDSPNAASSAPELGFLFVGVFFQAVGRIGDDGVDAVGLTVLHPLEAIPLNKLIGGGFVGSWLVDRLGFSDSRCEVRGLIFLVAVVSIGLPQDRRSFGWVLPQDLSNVSRQVTRQDQKRGRVDPAEFGKAPDRRLGWPSLAPLKAGNVSLGDPKSLRHIGLGQPALEAGRSQMLAKVDDAELLVDAAGGLRAVHAR